MLEKIAHEIGSSLRKYGRIGVTNTKEKHGLVRVTCHFGFFTLHDIIYPGVKYTRFSKRINNLDLDYISDVVMKISPFLEPIQERVYKEVYKYYIKKYPQFKKEILEGADYKTIVEEL